uniref:C-type lectin domain-containing protein n=1 Tax=Hucho hucho TaxID=62062 RepID=A0A4W5QX91_9TELE
MALSRLLTLGLCVLSQLVLPGQTEKCECQGPRGPPGLPGLTGPVGPSGGKLYPFNTNYAIFVVSAFVKYKIPTFVSPFNVTLTALIPGVSSAINYDFTRRFCTKRGLVLALPKNEGENTALTQVFDGAFKNAWLNVDNSKEGKFQVDLKVPSGDRGCTMLTESGAWQVTYDCSFNAYIVCEI